MHPLRQWRSSERRSRAHLATKAGITERTIFRVESGHVVPTLETAAALERATDGAVTVADILSAAAARSEEKRARRRAA